MGATDRVLEMLGAKKREAAPRAVAEGTAVNLFGTAAPPKRGSEELLKIYKRSPWLRSMISRIGGGVGAVEWKLYAGKNPRTGKYVRNMMLQAAPIETRELGIRKALATGELEEITDHPLLTLLQRPNVMDTGRNLRKLAQIHTDLIGESYWLKVRNGAGMPVELWLLLPMWIKETPNKDNGFAYRLTFNGFDGPIPASEILCFKDPDPENPYGRGCGIAQALADELDTDEYASKTVKAWFYNNATPSLLVSMKGADKDNIKRAEETWNAKMRGFQKAYRAYFTNGELDVQTVSQSFADQRLVEIRRFLRDLAQQVLGIPPEVIGILESSNRSTIDAAQYILGTQVLVPRLELQREVMQTQLVLDFDERLIVSYVSPVPEDREHRLKVMQARPQAFLVNDWREEAGKPADPNGNVYLLDTGLIATSNPAELGLDHAPEGDGEEEE